MKTADMTSKERLICALSGGQPDRIPVTPDISHMVPVRRTGKPFWEIYVNFNPPKWKAYLDAAAYYDFDTFLLNGNLDYKLDAQYTMTEEVESRDALRHKVRTTYHTPAGDLTQLKCCPSDNPPTITEKLVKNFKEDFRKYKYLFAHVTGADAAVYSEQKKILGDRGIIGVCIPSPGMQQWIEYFQGNLEALTYAYYDYPELFEELRELQDRQAVEMAEAALSVGVDGLLNPGSGSITLQSPDIWREYSLPTLRKVGRMCHQAGVIFGVHSCGKEAYIAETCADEPDIDFINPLEIPPMGDCDLAEIKRKFGGKVALMGNLHTSEVMLFGNRKKVRAASLQCMLDAGENGGFVLSTGDQCGRDTPDENIFEMIETAHKWGGYPFDKKAIRDEIARLESGGHV